MSKITLSRSKIAQHKSNKSTVDKTPSLNRAKSDSLKKTKSVKPALTKLKNSADELNSISDQTAEMVRDIEEFLSNECHIGFRACVKYTSSTSGLPMRLEYRRVGKSFRIAIVDQMTVSAFTSDKNDAKAWSDSSRADKIESIKFLPDLILAITKKVEEEITSAEEAATTVSDVLNSLTGNEY